MALELMVQTVSGVSVARVDCPSANHAPEYAENNMLTRLTLKRDEALLSVPGDLDCQLLAVDAGSNINRVPGRRDVGGMLNCSQGALACPRI
jgi:hypothetical protein